MNQVKSIASGVNLSLSMFSSGYCFTSDTGENYTILLYLSGRGKLDAQEMGTLSLKRNECIFLPTHTVWTLNVSESSEIVLLRFGVLTHPISKVCFDLLSPICNDINYKFSSLHMCEAIQDFAETIREDLADGDRPCRIKEYDFFVLMNLYYPTCKAAGFLYPYIQANCVNNKKEKFYGSCAGFLA